MKKIIVLFALLASTFTLWAQWKPAGDKIKTKWAETIDPQNVLPQYPRPIMERNEWANLNGLWQYAVLPIGKTEPAKFDGNILVPFAIASSLSGVQRVVTEKEELWYKHHFVIPSNWKNKNIILHFGAVDWKADVFVNDIKIDSHTGGYTPFSFDITPYLTKGEQKLVVKVWDPTDTKDIPRGKQIFNTHGFWYTGVTGIWQTVWLEPVSEKHITAIKTVANIDTHKLAIDLCAKNTSEADIFIVKIKDGTTVLSTTKFAAGQTIEIPIADAKLWSPESPFLYDLQITLIHDGKEVDNISSYAAMRKISTKRDSKGIMRLQLNNKPYFQMGTLDQGWWPDGLYTAPTDEALAFDIQKTKDLGFNMIRKHIKVESARWYAHCDRIGMLVWQDMPSSSPSPEWQPRKYFDARELVRSPQSEANFRKEWKEIIDFLYSYPSIVMWIPFNESWGQFKTVEIAEWTKAYDPSRLVNPASGGNHYRTGDVLDLHNYPGPSIDLYDPQRPMVLGEFGGIGLALEGHLWQADKNWGYVQLKTSKEATDQYIVYGNELLNFITQGISAAVYTQTTDVEAEINGLMTYDRKVMKVDENLVREINTEICKSLK